MMFDSLELSFPWYLLLLPLPILIHYFIPAYRTRKAVTKVPFLASIARALNETPSPGASQLQPRWWQRVFLLLSWGLLVLALCKPTVLGEPQTRQLEGRDIFVLLDLSGSMAQNDFYDASANRMTRLEAAKSVLLDFANQREGDRLGLILFGDHSFVQTPLTSDLKVWKELLSQTQVGMAGQNTALGDAIGLAIKVMQSSAEQTQKVAVILTDGNDTSSFVDPIEAAKVAASMDIKLHIIAMGDPKSVGEQAMDMETINQVAALSGGQAFEAMNQEQLEMAYQLIHEIEVQVYESQNYWSKRSLHPQILALVVTLYLGVFSLSLVTRYFKQRRQEDLC